jgi:dual specificity phosphatase 12
MRLTGSRIFGVHRARLIQEVKITHILSVIKYKLDRDNDAYRDVEHLSIDIDDMEDQDILVHLPKMVRFIERGLQGRGAKPPPSPSRSGSDIILPTSGAAASSSHGAGAVLVHCAMGKSRSVSAVIAYLLWKHPHRFGLSNSNPNPGTTKATARDAVAQALKWVRETRPVAEPNDGFMRQLEMWCELGCPADSDDAVERHTIYQRWLYRREVEDAARIGRAPDWIRFEDEEQASEEADAGSQGGGGNVNEMALRCKKCRRVLATRAFIIPHQGNGNEARSDCPHFFVEALSWMRPILEQGALDGRLICPNTKCAASIGRYAWQGFKCSCGDWVAPAFSLQRSKVDEVRTAGAPQHGGAGGAAALAGRMAALGIRMPPGPGTAGTRIEEKGNL